MEIDRSTKMPGTLNLQIQKKGGPRSIIENQYYRPLIRRTIIACEVPRKLPPLIINEVAREPAAGSEKIMPKESAAGTGRIIEQNRQEVKL